MIDQVHGISYGDLRWWIGVVEDRDNDPLQIGRVRVRIFGYHPQDTSAASTEDLPWAMVMMPTDSASTKGVGKAPTGLMVGSHVIGFFLDGDNAQAPLVIGSFFGAPNNTPDTNNLTRGEVTDTVISERNNSLLTSSANTPSAVAVSPIASLQSGIASRFQDATSQIADIRNATNQLSQLNFPAGSGVDIPGIATAMQGIQRGLLTMQTLSQRINKTTNDINGTANGIVGGVTGAIGEVEETIDEVTGLPSAVAQNAKAAVKDVQLAAKNSKDAAEQLKRDIKNYKEKIKAIEDIDLRNFQLPDVSLPDFRNLTQRVEALSNSISTISRMTTSLASVGQMKSAAGQLKSLSSMIPQGGAISGILSGMRSTGALSNTWAEPESQAAPEYPMNRMYESESGHIEEFDDTPGAERYHRAHPSGSFVEVHPDGSQVQKIIKDNYAITMGDEFIHIQGTVQVNIVGDSNVVINGNATTQVNGDKVDIVRGDYTLAVEGSYAVSTGSSHSQSAGTTFSAKAQRIDLN